MNMENREIKFRFWDKEKKIMCYEIDIDTTQFGYNRYLLEIKKFYIPLEFTGLKDKNGLTDIYDGDIIDSEGIIKGNIYETNKTKTDFVIQGFGTKTWCETYRRAILLGCKDAE